jgi:hypothetical protein
MWKMEGTFRAPPTEVLNLWAPEKYPTLEKRVVFNRIIDTHPPVDGVEHFDYYLRMKFPFPFQDRDELVRKFVDKRDPNRVMMWGSSVELEDVPAKKGAVRVDVKSTNLYFVKSLVTAVICSKDERDSELTKFTFFYYADLKGSLPFWLVNNLTKGCLKFLSAKADAIESKKHHISLRLST